MTSKLSPSQTRTALKTAWQIARDAAARFGGKVRQYLIEALRMAYAALRAPPEPVVKTVRLQPRDGRAWMARLTGKCEKFGYDREFLNKRRVGFSREPAVEFRVTMQEGAIYEYLWAHTHRHDTRGYWQVRGGELVLATLDEIEAALS